MVKSTIAMTNTDLIRYLSQFPPDDEARHVVKMQIHCESINHYVNWIKEGQHFAFAGYSDAEWYCVLGHKEGKKTGLGQTISAEHGKRLWDIIKRRHKERWFLFAVPKVLWTLPGFAEGQIDWFLGKNDILMEGYERDMVTDDLAREAGLYPFIRRLRGMKVCMIGNVDLRRLKPQVVDYDYFVEISTPNLHLEPHGIETAIAQAQYWGSNVRGKEVIYLVSAGVSAACIIDGLWGNVPLAWMFDCGSIWDAFVGIGGQREWRAELYADHAKLEKWKFDNLHGKDGRGW